MPRSTDSPRSSSSHDSVVGYDLEDRIDYAPRLSTSTIATEPPSRGALQESPVILQGSPNTNRRSRIRALSIFAPQAVDALNPASASNLSSADLDLEDRMPHDSDVDDEDDEEEIQASALKSKGSQGRGGWRMVGVDDGGAISSPTQASTPRTAAKRKTPNRFQPLDLTEKLWMSASLAACLATTGVGIGIVVISRT